MSTNATSLGLTDAATASGPLQLALVQYQPFHHVEPRLLEALAQALPWSDAVATAFREALARTSPSHRPSAAVGDGAGGSYEAARAQREAARKGAEELVRRPGRRHHDFNGGSDTGSDSGSDSNGGRSGSSDRRRRSRGFPRGSGGGSGGGGPALAAAHAIQLALGSLGAVPGHLTGAVEGRCSAAAFALSVAMASAAEGGLPPPLLRVVSPYRAGLEQLRPLGKGGFGSVVAVRSRLDHRLMALKTVAFRSDLPPWAPPDQLERQHAKLLREVQALAGLDGSPHVVRYYNAWIEPAWEKLGQQLQRSERGGEAGAAQASMQSLLQVLAAAKAKAKAKAAPATAPVREAPKASAAAAEPAAVAPTHFAHLPNCALPRLSRMDSSGTSGSHQSCRIQELSGSRRRSSSGGGGGGGSRSGSDDGGSDGEGYSRGAGAWSPAAKSHHHRRSPHRPVRATTPQRPPPPAEPLVDLPISPDGTAARTAAEEATAVVTAAATSLLEPIVTLLPSSAEPTRQRSLDSTLETLSGVSASGVSADGIGIGGITIAAAAVPPPLVSLASTPEEVGLLSRGWPVPLPPGRRRRAPPRPSQPLITSLSTSPEGPTGASPTRGSVLSSSVESIRVPPGGRIAASPACSHPKGSLTGADGSPGSMNSDGCNRRNADGGHDPRVGGLGRTRTPAEPEHYSWTFDRGDEPSRSGRGSGRSGYTRSGGDTTTSSSGSSRSSAPSATATAAADRARRGVAAAADDGEDEEQEEEFSWTFDRGDDDDGDGAEARAATRATGAGAASLVGSSSSGGGGGSGRGGSSSERTSRKGRRGKGRGGRFSEGIFHLEGATSTSERITRTRRRSSESSSGHSSTGSSRSDSEGESESYSGIGGIEGGSWSGSERGSGSSDSSSGSGNESGSESGSGSGSKRESEIGRDHYHRSRRRHSGRTGSRGGTGAVVPPSQAPLQAPRHQRRRQLPQAVVSSPTEDSTLWQQDPQQQGRRRRNGLPGGGRDGARPPPAAAAPAPPPFDLSVMSGIRRWPYTLYISMELVMGPTLTRWLQRRAEILRGIGRGAAAPEHPPEPATLERSIFRQLVTGLVHVHGADIIHRDIKPANIFLVPVVTAPGASSGGGWDGVAAGPEGAAVAARAPGVAERSYLVKIGDFGLAVGHEDASTVLSEATSSSLASAASSLSSSSSSSYPNRNGPFGDVTAACAAAAAGCRGGPHLPPSLPLLPAASMAAGSGGGGGVSGNAGAGAAGRPSAAPTGATARADVGLPRLNSSSTSSHTSGVGTASYSAPEQLREEAGGVSYYGPEVDIYPLGLILMELFCVHGTAMERANAMREARQGRLPASFTRAYPGEAKLAEACLRAQPQQRPTAAQILALLDILWGPQLDADASAAMGAAGAAAAAAVVSPKGAGSGGAGALGRGRVGIGGVSRSDAGALGGQGHHAFGVALRSEGGVKQRLVEQAGAEQAGARLRAVNDAKAAAAVTAAATGLMQRATSGPLPPRARPLVPPPRPLLPLPPPLPSSSGSSASAASRVLYDEGRTAFAVDTGRYRAAVTAVLEDVGTQTDLTWVSVDQPQPLPLAWAGRRKTAAAAPPPLAASAPPPLSSVVTAAPPADAAAAAKPPGGGAAAAATGPDGPSVVTPAGDGGKAALLARLQALEAEVLHLKEQLAREEASRRE